MTNHQPTQPELFDVAKLPGRPMLHWHGKRPLREVPYYPAQLRERYGVVVSPPLAGEGQVAVKIVDVLDEEWFGVVGD